jgi:hypothetical protein
MSRITPFDIATIEATLKPCKCGGALRVTDWGSHKRRQKGAPSDEFRFELWCAKCLDCDPNGYATAEECVASTYFAPASASRQIPG